MINGRKVLAIITARGGSKGVPRKNIQDLAGKPLIAWTIEAAHKSRFIDRTILSSEDQEIMDIAHQWDCEVPFVRPMELAQDDTPGMEPVLHALENAGKYDYVILLQPTSPLRTSEDIDQCLSLCLSNKAPACVSVTMPRHSPYLMYSMDQRLAMTPIMPVEQTGLRRQSMPTVVALNGAVYVAEYDWLMQQKTFVTASTIAYVMPDERSVDIDSEFDLQLAALLIHTTR